MTLVRTENGLQVHQGGKADDREIGPEHAGDLTAAINNLAEVTRRNLAFTEMLFWRLPPKDRCEILGVSPYIERKMRQQRESKEALEGGGR